MEDPRELSRPFHPHHWPECLHTSAGTGVLFSEVLWGYPAVVPTALIVGKTLSHAELKSAPCNFYPLVLVLSSEEMLTDSVPLWHPFKYLKLPFLVLSLFQIHRSLSCFQYSPVLFQSLSPPGRAAVGRSCLECGTVLRMGRCIWTRTDNLDSMLLLISMAVAQIPLVFWCIL